VKSFACRNRDFLAIATWNLGQRAANTNFEISLTPPRRRVVKTNAHCLNMPMRSS
jgi:hypothetical protein